MKALIAAICIGFALHSCQPKDSHSEEKESKKTSNESSNVLQKEKVIGSYVGLFGENPDENNKVTLLINYIDDKKVWGRTIVGGNDRPFEGTYSISEDGQVNIEADEPGDNRYDGHFSIKASMSNPQQISGSWTPFKNTTPAKSFKLDRKSFEYDPSVGNYPQSSERLLQTSELENLMKEDLAYMRNEIFARHGYCFQQKEWRQAFELNEWYVPNSISIKNMLTPVEKKNIEMIKRYEKYAEEYGDEFGR